MNATREPSDLPDLPMEHVQRPQPPWHLLGKRVRVTLARPEVTGDGPLVSAAVVTEGVLLGFGDDGEFEIGDGMSVHYCWPMLDIEEVEGR